MLVHERHKLAQAAMMLLTCGPRCFITFILVIVAFVFASTAGFMYKVVRFVFEAQRSRGVQPGNQTLLPLSPQSPHSVQGQAKPHTGLY